MKRVTAIGIVVLGAAVVLFLGFDGTRIEEIRREQEQATLPEPIPPEVAVREKQTEQKPAQNSTLNSPPSTLTSQISTSFNLAVPFTSQAPFGVWDEIHEDTCEEASVAMADAFYTKRTFTAESADQELRELIEWEKTRFGYWKDTNAEETALILREYYGFPRVEVRGDVTVESVKQEISRGNVVIFPVYGIGLNPFFTPPGPDYHMLVVKGFTSTKFITNDPGTRRGADFTYTFEKLISAVHDWNDGNVLAGRKVMIVVYPK